MERDRTDSGNVPHGTGDAVDAAEQETARAAAEDPTAVPRAFPLSMGGQEAARAAAEDPTAPVAHIRGDLPVVPPVEEITANNSRPGYMLRLWAWMGMGQCGFIVGAVLSVGSLVLVGESSFDTDWWIVVVLAALAWLGPPVFYTPSGSKKIAPAYSFALHQGLGSVSGLNAAVTDLPGSSATAVAIISVVWRFLVFSKSILGFVAGVASGGIVLLVSNLAGPVVGVVVAAATVVAIVVFTRRRPSAVRSRDAD